MPCSPPSWLSPLLNLISFQSEIPDLVDRIVPDNASRGQGPEARRRHREERDFLDESDPATFLLVVAHGRAITQSVAIRPWCKHPAECCDDEERAYVIPVRDRKRKTISKWILRLQNRRLIKKSNVKETKGEEIKTPELPGKDGKKRKITPKAHEVVLKSTPELDEVIHGLRPHVSKHAVDLVLALLKENAHPEAKEAARLLREITKEKKENRDENMDHSLVCSDTRSNSGGSRERAGDQDHPAVARAETVARPTEQAGVVAGPRAGRDDIQT